MSCASSKLATPPALRGTPELLTMLSFRRPAWTDTERQFINRFIRPLGVTQDTFGNLYKRIGTAPVLWSCHTDTVHDIGGTQRLRVSSNIVAQSDPKSNCLGADCTAGVWLMVEMIRANVPGLYIFHRAEEIGGLGSAFIAEDTPELLAGILYAIAFDRRAHTSIITHQWAGRCCSEAFSVSLARGLAMRHTSDSGGSFTDTANYTDLIGECTNISVGYMNEHTKAETLDTAYLSAVRDALVALDVSQLVNEREPGAVDPDDYSFNFDDDEQDLRDMGAGVLRSSGQTLMALVRDHPDEVADWLEEYGIQPSELETAIYLRGGVVRQRS